ncbi:hypothetical protein BJV82DRAFT_665430 [Fennellomyces sp. T-0311]|nr:hypothetical protein BJV82DRAFT_665430 [Fennellomyces sp. T-0311]
MRVSWKVPLAALCTAALVAFSSSGVTDAAPSPWVQENHPILDILGRKLYHNKREITDLYEVCPLDSNSIAGAMFLHFTAIFFDDFTTGGGTDILGPLAVGGRFTAPNYIVNANRGQDCSVDPRTGLDGIGLVVQGLTITYDTRVHGYSLHAGGGDLAEIKELNEGDGCRVYNDINTGAFDFGVAENAAIRASLILALTEPNMYMDGDGKITDLGSSNSAYKVFTFNTCNDGNCNVGGVLSNPDAIFLGNGNFNGPTGDVPSNDDTVVFNIPVTEGDTIELKTNFPSKGFYACRTIYNFYPVNSEGIFSSAGEITVFRNTGGQLEGFTLAPRAHIRDGTTGAFAGTIIGLDYAWHYLTTGVELHDYAAADDNCRIYDGCFPISTTETPQYTTVTVTATAPASTVTDFATQTVTSATTATRTSTQVTVLTKPSTMSVPVTITHPGSTYTTTVATTETLTETNSFVTEYTTHSAYSSTYEIAQILTYTFDRPVTHDPSTVTETVTSTETTSAPETITTTITEPDGSTTIATYTTYSPLTTTETYLTTETHSGFTETREVTTTETSYIPSVTVVIPTDDQIVSSTMYSVDTEVTTEYTESVVEDPGSVETSYSLSTNQPLTQTETLTQTIVETISTVSTYTTEHVTTITGDQTVIETVSQVPPEPTTRTRTTGALTTISEYPLTTTTTTVYVSTYTAQPRTTVVYAYDENQVKDKWKQGKGDWNHGAGAWDHGKGEWEDDKKGKKWDEGKKKGEGEEKGKKKGGDWEDDEDCDDDDD